MKQLNEYTKRFRRLLATWKLSARKSKRAGGDDSVTRIVLRSVLLEYSGEAAASSALRRMESATVDHNELRVTPIAEVVDHLGRSFPNARHAANAVSRTLNSIFNRRHNLNLDFLRTTNKKDARQVLDTLDGVTAFSAALAAVRALGHHAVPLNADMHEWLRDQKLVHPEALLPDVQRFLERNVPVGKANAFFVAFRRQLAARRPRETAAKPKRSAAPAPTVKKQPASSSGNTRRISKARLKKKRSTAPRARARHR